MSEYNQHQHQNMLVIDQFRTKKGGKYHCEIDTAPHPLNPRIKTPEAINWPVHYMYASDRILVREEYLDRVHPIMRRLGNPKSADVIPVIRGLFRLSLGRKVKVHEAVKEVHKQFGGGAAAPDHLISLTPGNGTGGACPACEPTPVPVNTAPYPGVSANRSAGQGVRVVVIDTGIDQNAIRTHDWLREGVSGQPDPMVPSPSSGSSPPSAVRLGTYAGHGTFIAGLIKAMAPAAEVYVRNDIAPAGVIRESDLVTALDDVLANDNPDIINLSAGVWSGGSAGPVGFQVFNEIVRHHKGVVVVAAAGNNGSRRPFWPAATPWAVGVGALNRNGTELADFTDHGGWVDAYAPGQDLVNAFPVGTYYYTEPPFVTPTAEFTGLASWSGTSFATPLVAGMIAAEMSRTGRNGIEAKDALLRAGQTTTLAGRGSVLLPG